MEKITNWNSLWRELVEIKSNTRKKLRNADSEVDIWDTKAVEFKESVKKRWVKPDSSRDFILSQMDSKSTVLDIGAGTGAWSLLLARQVRHVTAIEPSTSMIEVMRESLTQESIKNVHILQAEWPALSLEPHDFSLCSHAMYGYPDFAAFIAKMVACTKRTCFLVMRAPSLDGVRAEAARHIWGQPLDSPNFTIAYNILLQMGIFANVLMEDTGLWKPRTSESLEDALGSMKRRFGLLETREYDDYLMDLLRRRLTWQDNRYIWPREVRTALVYWNPSV
jgi:2-polyprenyl-3-methyl-5-hydroxy-6-metoxy-1,4-benzoquinol methylase